MIRFSARKPLTVFVAVIVVIVLGVVALRGMTPDLLPNMDFPYVIIVTTYPGAAPEAVEQGVTRPIEQSMATLDSIETVSSTSSDSLSMVILQFQTDSQMDGIMVDILSKLDSLRSGFDDMVGAPYILRINPSMLPVEVAAVDMEGMDIGELSQFASDTLIPALEGVTGVAGISAYGLMEEQVEVRLNADKIEAVNQALTELALSAAAGESAALASDELLASAEASGGIDLSESLSLQTVAAVLAAQDFDMPAGYVYEDGIGCIVSVGNEIADVQELENLLLFDLGLEGAEPVRLRDVADVTVTGNADSVYARLNGETGLLLTFSKQSSYPTAGVCANIREAFAELSAQHEGLEFVSLMDQGDYINEIIRSIFSSLLWGALFSAVILLIFLRDLRPTFVTLCSIPVSLLFALVLMHFSGVTLNMMSMAGLAIAVGMLVDNSVVVIENTYRLRRLGESPVKAAVSGAAQVAGAVAASTVTTVCVFVPLAFSDGITKQLFTDVALTMAYSLAASLVISLTLVPAMAGGMLRRIGPERRGLLARILPAYRRLLGWMIRHKALPILVALVLLAGSAAAVIARGFSFLPPMESTQITLTITMPEDTDTEQAMAWGDEVLARVRAVEGVDTVAGMMSSGASGLNLLGGDGNSISGYVTMDPDSRRLSSDVVRDIEAVCADLPCQVTADNGSAMSTFSTVLGGSGITVRVYASELEALQEGARITAETLASVQGVESADSGIEDPAPELHITVDKDRAMQQGLTVAQVYQLVAEALAVEAEAASVRFDGLDHAVIVKTADKSELTRQYLEQLSIPVTDSSGAETTLYLRELVQIEQTQTLSTIQREEQRRYLSATAAVAEGYSVTQVTAAAERAMAEAELPEGVKYEFSGENETIMEAMEDLLVMLLVGVLLVYLVMVAQFQSLRAPFIVMFTIPLAFTGGFLALQLCGMDLNILSMLGMIMLTGVIVNNGIVLVDCINQLRLAGMERREAIAEACVIRMRPVLMTSITTVLGMLVMALGRDESAMLMQPLAVTCIGGLVYGTFMTLFVVPCIYDLLSRRELRKVREADLELSDK